MRVLSRTLMASLMATLMASSSAMAEGGASSQSTSAEYSSSIDGRTTKPDLMEALAEAVDAHDEAVSAARYELRRMDLDIEGPEGDEPSDYVLEEAGLGTEGVEGEESEVFIRDEVFDVAFDLEAEVQINTWVQLQDILDSYRGDVRRGEEPGIDELMADIDRLIEMTQDIESGAGESFGVSDVIFGLGKAFVNFMRDTQKTSQELLWEQEERDGRDYDGDGIVGEPNRRQDSDDDDEDIWVDEAPEDDGPGTFGPLGGVLGGMDKDGSLESLIAMLDRSYDPVAFGGAAQASLETSGLQDIRALVDEQLEAFEQLDER